MRTIIAGGAIVIFIFVQLWRQGSALRTIDGDGSGYYAYLTAVFIHHSTDFTKVYELEKSRRGLDYMAHYFHDGPNGKVNKYYMGTALMMLPFFLSAWLFSWFSGMPADGYNILFQYAVSFGAAVWLGVGLIAVVRLLGTFGFERKVQLITILSLLFGTNLFYYAFLHPSHSHVYSFAVMAVFLLCARRFLVSENKKMLHYAALFLGFVALIRPTNVLVVMALPFLAGDRMVFVEKSRWLLQHPRSLFLSVVILLSVFSLQAVFHYIQTGQLFFWTYQQEGFRFENPAMIAFLVSYRKGFFVYTPLMLLLIPALVRLFQRSHFQFFSFVAYFVLMVLVLSSWWNWFYGDSFGMRAMIDHYALLSIPLATGIQQLFQKGLMRYLLALFLPLVIALNLLQTYQYQQGIIHPDSMNKEKYWHVFLKTDPSYRHILGECPEPVFEKLRDDEAMVFMNDMESPSNFWTSNGIVTSKTAFSGHRLADMNQSNIYSPTLVLQDDLMQHADNEKYINVNLMYRESSINALEQSLLVYAATNDQNRLSFYKTFRIKQLPDTIVNSWCNASFGFKVPPWSSEVKQVKLYVWNRSAAAYQLDDIEVTIYYLKE